MKARKTKSELRLTRHWILRCSSTTAKKYISKNFCNALIEWQDGDPPEVLICQFLKDLHETLPDNLPRNFIHLRHEWGTQMRRQLAQEGSGPSGNSIQLIYNRAVNRRYKNSMPRLLSQFPSRVTPQIYHKASQGHWPHLADDHYATQALLRHCQGQGSTRSETDANWFRELKFPSFVRHILHTQRKIGSSNGRVVEKEAYINFKLIFFSGFNPWQVMQKRKNI